MSLACIKDLDRAWAAILPEGGVLSGWQWGGRINSQRTAWTKDEGKKTIKEEPQGCFGAHWRRPGRRDRS